MMYFPQGEKSLCDSLINYVVWLKPFSFFALRLCIRRCRSLQPVVTGSTRCHGASCIEPFRGEAMVKRPAQFIDLTIDETAVRPKVVDLTNDETEFLDSTACLPSGKLRVEIPWISKLPMLDPSIRKKKVPPLRQQDNIIIADIRKAAEWFEQTEILFSGAMPQ